jgi:hypothetical protein
VPPQEPPSSMELQLLQLEDSMLQSMAQLEEAIL